MNTFSIPADLADELPAPSTMAAPLCDTSQPLAKQPVSESRLSLARYLRDLDAADSIGGCFFDAMGQAQRGRAAEMIVAGRCRIRADSGHHYLYRLTDPATGEFYVGVRSCRCAPHEDRRYFGSGRWPQERQWRGQPVQKDVLATFPTRRLAEEAEELLIDMVLLDRLCRNSWTSASAAFKATNPGRCRRGTR